ncbi:hypothetical protein AKJ16_DCAP01451 [Drosera capensis]
MSGPMESAKLELWAGLCLPSKTFWTIAPVKIWISPCLGLIDLTLHWKHHSFIHSSVGSSVQFLAVTQIPDQQQPTPPPKKNFTRRN